MCLLCVLSSAFQLDETCFSSTGKDMFYSVGLATEPHAAALMMDIKFTLELCCGRVLLNDSARKKRWDRKLRSRACTQHLLCSCTEGEVFLTCCSLNLKYFLKTSLAECDAPIVSLVNAPYMLLALHTDGNMFCQ